MRAACAAGPPKPPLGSFGIRCVSPNVLCSDETTGGLWWLRGYGHPSKTGMDRIVANGMRDGFRVGKPHPRSTQLVG